MLQATPPRWGSWDGGGTSAPSSCCFTFVLWARGPSGQAQPPSQATQFLGCVGLGPLALSMPALAGLQLSLRARGRGR